jgi:hypothetical protein
VAGISGIVGVGRFWTFSSYLSDYRDIPMSLDKPASKCILELYYNINHFSFQVSKGPKSLTHSTGRQTDKDHPVAPPRTSEYHMALGFCALARDAVGGESGLSPPSRRHVTAYACGLFGTGRQEGVRWTA